MFGITHLVLALVGLALLLLLLSLRLRGTFSARPFRPGPDEIRPIHKGKAEAGGCKFDEAEVRRTRFRPTPPIDLSNIPPADPRVMKLLSCIHAEEMKELLLSLSGEKPVYIGGESVTVQSRSTYTQGCWQAMTFLEQFYGSMKIEHRRFSYKIRGRELYVLEAIKRGKKNPNRILYVGSHLDSTAGSVWGPEKVAPGADDDLTGTWAVAKLMELIKDLDLDCTVIGLHFTGEEQGLWGSYKYSDAVADAKTDVIGMLQADMIGYCRDFQNNPRLDIHDNENQNGSHELVVAMFRNIVRYGLRLKPVDTHNHAVENRSDHAGFLDHGYKAVLISEEFSDEGFNPFYHSVDDKVSAVSLPFYVEATRALVATAIDLAGLPPSEAGK